MGNNQERIEFTDPETGKVFPINATSLVSNVRDVLMSRRRNQVEAKTWSMLKEDEQQDEITSMQELARDLVGKVVEVVAEKGLVCAHVAIQKFAVDVDKGIVQITSSGFASDEMLTDLAHAKGKVAKLTIVDERQFNEKSTLLVADKDQPSLLPDDEDTAIGEALKNARTDADITAEMDAAEAELDGDGMEEPDDLHEPETPDQSTEWIGGFQSRMGGFAQSLNPFFGDGGTKEKFEDWDSGWLEANGSDDAPDVDLDLGQVPVADESPEVSTEPEIAQVSSEADPDLGDLTPMQHGQQARLKGDGPDDNPFDGGTDGHAEWAGGYEAADAEIQTLIEAGRKAGADGEDKKKCPWKKGTDGERFWLEGWVAGKPDA